MAILECQNITKKYGNKVVLDNINLKISSGKIIGLLGKNGVGKSTLLKVINGLLVPEAGKVLFNNKEIGVESKEHISYMPERTYLDKDLKVNQVIKFFSEFYTDFDVDKAYRLLKDLNLDSNSRILTMSKGMQEKFQLILVMSRKAELYILDEPLGGVDPATRDYILDTILKNRNPKSSIIISTHMISDIEKVLDEVIFIDNGKLVLHSDSKELKEKENGSIDEIFRRMFNDKKIS